MWRRISSVTASFLLSIGAHGAGPGFGRVLCRTWSPVLVRMVSLPPLLGSQASKDIPALQQEKSSMGGKGTKPRPQQASAKQLPYFTLSKTYMAIWERNFGFSLLSCGLRSPVILPGSRNDSKLLLLSLRFLMFSLDFLV